MGFIIMIISAIASFLICSSDFVMQGLVENQRALLSLILVTAFFVAGIAVWYLSMIIIDDYKQSRR